MSDDDSHDYCGFTLSPENIDREEEFDSEEEWYEQFSVATCIRKTWKDSARCIWHTKNDNKPVDKLIGSRGNRWEVLDGAVLSSLALKGKIEFEACSLLGVDCSSSNLEGTNLTEADLRYADFSKSRLTYADLSDVDLQKAELSNANLNRADLSKANLQEAKLSNANLLDADLSNADLQEAELSNTNLNGADLSWAFCLETDIPEASLIHADLSEAYLGKVNLSGTDLRYATLGMTLAVMADFSKADLRKADLSEAMARNIDLFKADLRNSDLSEADLRKGNLKKANLEQSNLTLANAFSANLTGARLNGAIFQNFRLDENTEFGDHYLGKDDSIEAATWTYAQIERLYREAALPKKVRSAITERKDRRRRHYWRNSLMPDTGKRLIHWVKSTGDDFGTTLGNGLRKLINWIGESRGEELDSNENEASDSGHTKDEDDGEPIHTETEDDLSTWNRLVNTVQWAGAATTGVLMRYGESTKRVLALSVGTIAVSALLYPIWGIRDTTMSETGEVLTYALQQSTLPTLIGKSLYFSTMTFTTVGYGDLQPVAWSQTLATIESFAGALLMATLVWVLGRRATR